MSDRLDNAEMVQEMQSLALEEDVTEYVLAEVIRLENFTKSRRGKNAGQLFAVDLMPAIVKEYSMKGTKELLHLARDPREIVRALNSKQSEFFYEDPEDLDAFLQSFRTHFFSAFALVETLEDVTEHAEAEVIQPENFTKSRRGKNAGQLLAAKLMPEILKDYSMKGTEELLRLARDPREIVRALNSKQSKYFYVEPKNLDTFLRSFKTHFFGAFALDVMNAMAIQIKDLKCDNKVLQSQLNVEHMARTLEIQNEEVKNLKMIHASNEEQMGRRSKADKFFNYVEEQLNGKVSSDLPARTRHNSDRVASRHY